MRALIILGAAVGVAACGGADTPVSETGAGTAAQHVEATAAEHAGDAPEPTPITELPIDVPLLEQELAYGEVEGANLEGFLAMPRDVIEPPPGVIVIHEWWGLNDNIRAMTRQLAAEGYVALAVDLYGGEVTDDPARAERLMSDLLFDEEATRSNLRQAYEYLSRYAFSPRVGAVGWCLGGGWALETALMLPEDLDAVVMYYGRIETDTDRLRELAAPMLGLFAERDESIPVRSVQEFRTRLRELGKNAEIFIYSDVGHAFANPSGGNYDAESAESAWRRTTDFLARHLE